MRTLASFQIDEEPVSTLAEQATVSISFQYDRILELQIIDNGLGGFHFEEIKLEAPRMKDYDTNDPPSSWSTRFDVSQWGFMVARSQGDRVGGAVIAFASPELFLLEGRKDLAVLWDIRVDMAFRGAGIGGSLVCAAEKWARARQCRQLKIETQNINLAACKLYERQGCKLGAVNRFAYPSLPDEIQMLWYKDLA